MGRFVRMWGVSGAAWAAVLALTGAAIAAGALSETTPSLSISPPGLVDGKTIDSDEPFEMTLHLQADANATYDLALTYEGDAIGACQADTGTIETNPQGKGVWTCEFDTAVNEGELDLTGTITYAVSQGGGDATTLVATLSVRPAEEEEVVEELTLEEETVEVTQEDDEINHGHCVSYWAHQAKEQGLEGRARGEFISTVAQDPDAVAPKTAADGDPGAECDFQEELTAALAEQEAQQLTSETDGDASVKGARGGKGGKPEK